LTWQPREGRCAPSGGAAPWTASRVSSRAPPARRVLVRNRFPCILAWYWSHSVLWGFKKPMSASPARGPAHPRAPPARRCCVSPPVLYAPYSLGSGFLSLRGSCFTSSKLPHKLVKQLGRHSAYHGAHRLRGGVSIQHASLRIAHREAL